MAIITKAPRGTQDILPDESPLWQRIERAAVEVAKLHGFEEMRIPTFEHTELFQRGVGEATDVVQKEMYTFLDKGGRSITLRPEGTAGVARAVLEHGLLGGAMPLKVCYLVSAFRYEKPQAGRLREFHQFGAEMFGSGDPAADAGIILLAAQVIEKLGIQDVRLELNSIGCQQCRPAYHEALRAYFKAHEAQLCPTCHQRLEKNPMRILDCKNESCRQVAKGAPVMLDSLCPACEEHFAETRSLLDSCGIAYIINPKIVRGLDYYTRTVFEFITGVIGSQGTVCGGGRYDGLIEEFGGAHTPALGFAMGLERMVMLLQKQRAEQDVLREGLFVACMDGAAKLKAMELCARLTAAGVPASTEVTGRSLKAQIRYADKKGMKYLLVLGTEELETGRASIKDMDTGESFPLEGMDAWAGQITGMLCPGQT